MAFRQELRVSSGVAPAHGAARAAGAHAPLSRTHLSSHAPIPAHEAWLLLRRPRRRTPSTDEPQALAYWQAAGPFFARLFFAGWCEIRGRPTALPAPCMRRRVIKPTISFARPLTSASPPRYSVASGGITLGPRVGQGTVRFASAEECRRALVNLNGHHMGNRYIELFFS